MSYSPEQLEKIAANFDKLAIKELITTAETSATKARNEAQEKGLCYGWGGGKHGWVVGSEADLKKKGVAKVRKPNLDSNAAKDKKKLDPKAKVRNRGTVCVPAASAKDKKDHFPINDEGQARNALARVQQYSSVPEWYSGSLKGLQALVSRKVHSKYPGIGKSDKKKKSSLESVEHMFNKYGQDVPPMPGPANQGEEEFHPETEDMFPRHGVPAQTGDVTTPQQWGTYDPATGKPVATPVAPHASGWTGERIDPTFQKMLGVNPDGKLGSQTQHALNRYKASRNPNMTNALAYEYLKKEPEYASRSEMRYDDNSNTYARSAHPTATAALENKLLARWAQTETQAEEDARIDKAIEQLTPSTPAKTPAPTKNQKAPAPPKGDVEFGRKPDVLKVNPPAKASLEDLMKRYG